MKKVFLESHNIKNRASGFGVFNYSLIKAFADINPTDLKLILNVKNISSIKSEFGNVFGYNRYLSLQRHSWWGVTGKFDVWHCMNQNIKVEPLTCPNKYILTVHDVNFAEDPPNNKRVKEFENKLNRTDEITYVSEYARTQTHKFFDVPKINEKIIYNGNPITETLNTSEFIPHVSIDKPFFYSIGVFQQKKNFKSLVRMMSLIKDYNLILSGNENTLNGNEVRMLIKELNLENRVFMIGRISELAKQYYMKNCTAFLFPSIGEGFGLPPIEAMRFGKPVFLSKLGSLPEIGGEVAFYWENFDPEYMKEILFEKLDEFQDQKSSMEISLKKRADFFNWIDAANSYLESYRS